MSCQSYQLRFICLAPLDLASFLCFYPSFYLRHCGSCIGYKAHAETKHLSSAMRHTQSVATARYMADHVQVTGPMQYFAMKPKKLNSW